MTEDRGHLAAPGGIVPAEPPIGAPGGEAALPDLVLRGFAGGGRRRPRGVWYGRRGVRLLALAIAVAFVLWLARGVIGPFVVAAVIAYAFAPVVSAAQARTGLPRSVVILTGYAVAFVLLGVIVALVANQLGDELSELSGSGPDVVAQALQRVFGNELTVFGQHIPVATLSKQIRAVALGLVQTPTDALHMAERAVDAALQAVLTVIIAFYFLLDGDRFFQFALRFLDRRRRVRTVQIANRIHGVLGRWLRGQLFLIALVAAVLYVVLGPILSVKFALVVAILSGVLEIIPLVGPVFAASLATIVAFGSGGPDVALAVLVVYAVVREIEDQVVMPIVIGRAVELHPVVTIFAVLVGLSVGGILGGLLGVPVAAALNVTLHELYPEETAEAEAAAAGRLEPVAVEAESGEPASGAADASGE